jgi:hypothetical protein
VEIGCQLSIWTRSEENHKNLRHVEVYLPDIKKFGPYSTEKTRFSQKTRCIIITMASRLLRLSPRHSSSGICGGQSDAGAGFLRVLRFPLPIFIPPNSPSSQSPGAGTIGQLTAGMPSGSSLDSTLHMRIKKIILLLLMQIMGVYSENSANIHKDTLRAQCRDFKRRSRW